MNKRLLDSLQRIGSIAVASPRYDFKEHSRLFDEIREIVESATGDATAPPPLTGRHAGGVRGFSHLAEAYYGNACKGPDRDDDLNIGIFYPQDGGGTTGEFSIVWSELGGNSVPLLRVYDDAWEALSFFPDLLAGLATLTKEAKNATPAEVIAVLKACDIVDLTKRDDPYAKAPPATHSDPRDALADFVDRLMPAFDRKTRDEAHRLLDAAKGKP